MAGRLTAEDVVTMEVLSKRDVATRAIARPPAVSRYLRPKGKRVS